MDYKKHPLIKELRAYLTEGSTLYQRMSEGRSNDMPEEFQFLIDYMTEQGLTAENFDDFFAENYPEWPPKEQS